MVEHRPRDLERPPLATASARSPSPTAASPSPAAARRAGRRPRPSRARAAPGGMAGPAAATAAARATDVARERRSMPPARAAARRPRSRSDRRRASPSTAPGASRRDDDPPPEHLASPDRGDSPVRGAGPTRHRRVQASRPDGDVRVRLDRRLGEPVRRAVAMAGEPRGASTRATLTVRHGGGSAPLAESTDAASRRATLDIGTATSGAIARIRSSSVTSRTASASASATYAAS